MKPDFGRALSVLFVCIFLFISCSISSPAIQPGDFQSLTAALDRNVPSWLQRYQVPGTTVALVVNGEVAWTQGYGLADQAQGKPAGADTVYQIASISKPVTAWGAMQLVEQGKFDLDAPVNQYLTRWSLPASDYNLDEITAKRLLSHSAGLSVHGYAGTLPDERVPSIEESLSGVYDASNAVDVVNTPGATYSYSGGGYTLMQLIIEEISGQSFSEFMQAEVIAPLGLAHTSFEWREDLKPLTATAYDWQRKPLPNYLFTEKAAAGLYTTAGELAQFGAAALPGPAGEPVGRGVLSPASIETMFTTAIEMPEGTLESFLIGMDGYGLGYFIETLPDGSTWYSHTGGNQGWRSLLIIAPKQNAALVVLTNSDNGDAVSSAVTQLWADWLGSGTPKRLERMGVALNVLSVFLVILLLLAGWRLFNLARQMRQGKRKLGFQLKWRQVFDLLSAVVLVGLWLWMGEYIVNIMFPQIVNWMSLMIYVWAVALVAPVGLVSVVSKKSAGE